MAILLSNETQKLVERQLQAGGYNSADEVVVAALNALQEIEAYALDDLSLNAIDRAEDQIDRGEVHDWKDVKEQVRAKFLGK